MKTIIGAASGDGKQKRRLLTAGFKFRFSVSGYIMVARLKRATNYVKKRK